MPTAFELKKQTILRQLTVPQDDYSDRSPKGSIDEGILELVNEINALPGLITTSSCAGRVSVFLEGKKRNAASLDDTTDFNSGESSVETVGGPGGKGGGRWLFVSHDSLNSETDYSQTFHNLFGLRSASALSPIPSGARLVHLKFEAMVRSHLRTCRIIQAYICRFYTSLPGLYKTLSTFFLRLQQLVFVKVVLLASPRTRWEKFYLWLLYDRRDLLLIRSLAMKTKMVSSPVSLLRAI
jgi:tRNA(Phe) wybutosine-synthesizing methylase Tyw3